MNLARLSILAGSVVLAAEGSAHAQSSEELDPDAILGVWTTEEEEGEWSRVEVYRCEELYCGRIIWLSEPTYDEAGEWGNVGEPKVDWENPEEELRTRPIIGLELMHSFRFDSDKWKDGRIYDPQSGSTYRCELSLAENGAVLKVRGYVRLLFVNVGRTTEWQRYSEEESGG